MMKQWRMASAVTDLADVDTMKKSLVLDQVPISQIQDGQVLVQVACCTINDEDRLHFQNEYINSKDILLPRAVGFEGAGKVVASKAPWYLFLKEDSRVAFYSDTATAMGEYLVCDALTVIPIPDGVSYSTGAASVTNPFTVLQMVLKVKRAGHTSVINTVGAGALGRLFSKHAKSVGIDVICLVRRDSQKEMCQADGAKVVLNMTDADFGKQLSRAIQDHNCQFAYDGLGGDMPDRLLKALPDHSVVSVYSEIVSNKITVDTHNLYHEKRVEAFNAAVEAKKLWTYQQMSMVSTMQKWMTTPDMQTTIRRQFSLEQLPEAVVDSTTANKSDGKVQIVINADLK